MTHKEFKQQYLAAEGMHPKSDCDSKTEIKTYIIPKEDFYNSFKEVLYSMDLEHDGNLEREVHLFSRFRASFHCSSIYDCTGDLCSYSQSVRVINDRYEWTVIVSTHYTYDY